MNIKTLARRISALEGTEVVEPVYRRLIVESNASEDEISSMIAAAQEESGRADVRIILRTIIDGENTCSRSEFADSLV